MKYKYKGVHSRIDRCNTGRTTNECWISINNRNYGYVSGVRTAKKEIRKMVNKGIVVDKHLKQVLNT